MGKKDRHESKKQTQRNPHRFTIYGQARGLSLKSQVSTAVKPDCQEKNEYSNDSEVPKLISTSGRGVPRIWRVMT